MDRGWTQNRALPGSVKQIVGARYPPAAAKTDTPKKKDAEFHDYASSVSDVWDAGISVDNTLVNTSAAKVIQMHANGATSKNDIVMPNCNPHPVPSKNNKTRAMQMLAMQSNPPVRPTNTTASNTPLPASGIYPRLGGDTSTASSSVPAAPRGGPTPLETADQNRFHRLSRMLNNDDAIDMEQLRENCWMGIPHALRPDAWRILSGYVPTHAARREVTLNKKRDDYWKFVEQYFHTRYDEQHHETFRQISIDVPRMSPLIPLFQQKAVQEIFERVLYIWAVRHPASGYVQGINDLVTPFFVVFLSEHISPDVDVGSFEVTQLAKAKVDLVEADSFWCVTALLDTIQDNYTFAQPGIQRKVADLKDLLSRVDPVLYKHLENNQVEFLQFAFRWMNNLLMREIPLRATIRLWDTYLSELSGFSEFHTYVCAAFLRLWSKQLLAEADFQGIMLLLQSLPTQSWTDKQICELTADAFSLMSVFHGAKNHLNNLTPR
uniref:Rab-GAP TBC domain-containing protein n=1 Tax=Panagrellus redivivus TaxID=6233 RepID=A0A7E4WAX6_PANRE